MEDKTEGIEKILEFLAENFKCSGCPLQSYCGTPMACKEVLKEYLLGKEEESEAEKEKEAKTISDFINQVIDDLNKQMFGFKDPEQPAEEHEEPIQPKVTFRANLDGSTELSGSPEAVAEFMRKVGGSIGL